MELSELLVYLKQNGWKESSKFKNHYLKDNTKGLVAVDTGTNEAFIVERVADFPWARISDIKQFERDLAHLQD